VALTGVDNGPEELGKPYRRTAEAAADKALRALWMLLARLATCQCCANTSEQAIFTTWLAQIANYTVTQGPLPMGIIRGGCYQDRRDGSTGGGEVPIQIRPSHHRHVDVHDQARCARQIRRLQKISGRCKGLHGESVRSKETSKRLPYRIIIIYYRYLTCCRHADLLPGVRGKQHSGPSMAAILKMVGMDRPEGRLYNGIGILHRMGKSHPISSGGSAG
jgi:hypothetical protein